MLGKSKGQQLHHWHRYSRRWRLSVAVHLTNEIRALRYWVSMSSLQFATTEKGSMSDVQVAEVVARSCPQSEFRNKSVLLLVPDGTRTAPVGTMFNALHACIGEV